MAIDKYSSLAQSSQSNIYIVSNGLKLVSNGLDIVCNGLNVVTSQAQMYQLL